MSGTIVSFGSAALARPRAVRGIRLVENATVAGTRHIANIREVADRLVPGERLCLERDRGNVYDEWAVRVLDEHACRLGYVSCEHNEIVARLLDGGKRVSGRFKRTQQSGGWTRIEMEVYLDD